MDILIRSKSLRAGGRLRRFVVHRLQSSLGRLWPSLGGATVYLSDVNGPRGGEDKVCRIDARLRSGGRVFVEETGAAVAAAVAGAAERVAMAVSRAVARRRETRRRRAPRGI